MLPDRVSNPGPLTYESGALPIALRGPAHIISIFFCISRYKGLFPCISVCISVCVCVCVCVCVFQCFVQQTYFILAMLKRLSMDYKMMLF